MGKNKKLITGILLFATAAATGLAALRGPFTTGLGFLKKQSETRARGWAVDSTPDGSIVAIGSPYLKQNNSVFGFVLLDIKGTDNFIVLGDSQAGGDGTNMMSGSSVAISPDGKIVVSGGPGMSSKSPGSVSIYMKPSDGWKTPKDQNYVEADISIDGPEAGWRFGYKTAISEDGKTVAVSAPGYEGYGRVYYLLTPKGGWPKYTSMDEVDTGYLGVGSPKKGDEFGAALAISRDDSTIVAGAPGRNKNTGEAYYFKKPSKGWLETESLVVLTSDDLRPGARFGESIDVSDDGSVVIVGAPGQYGKSNGDVFIFTDIDFDKGSYTVHSMPNDYNTDDFANIGISVSISADGKTGVAGTYFQKDMGSIMIYKSADGTWNDAKNVNQISYTEENESTLGALAGFSVYLSPDGKKLLMGAPLYNKGDGAYMWVDL